MKYFYKDIVIEVPENVYYPREDTELFAKNIEKTALNDKNALEIGCGSGILSIIMAKNGAITTSVDINSDAVEITKTNAEKNNVKINVVESDLFENIEGVFDIIIFNPPYLPTESEERDITYSGGISGRETIERFIAESKNHVKKDGIILVLISSL